jgi:hypothetical protein
LHPKRGILLKSVVKFCFHKMGQLAPHYTLALFITLAALLVQALGFALWCTVAVVAMYLQCVDAEAGAVTYDILRETV